MRESGVGGGEREGGEREREGEGEGEGEGRREGGREGGRATVTTKPQVPRLLQVTFAIMSPSTTLINTAVCASSK